ncbi:hypothetical protein RYX36_032309 [Vicia faba]
MMHHMLPCKLEEREYEQSVVKSKPKPIVHFQTFFSSNDVFGTARRLLSDNGNHPSQEGQHGYCAAKGKVPLLSLEGLHRLHIFIFVLAICHVAISVLTIVFGGLIIRKWKHWEHSIGVDEDNESQHASERAEEVTHVHEHEFIQYHVFGSGKNSAITGWVSSIPSVFSLVREILHDKKQEEIPIVGMHISGLHSFLLLAHAQYPFQRTKLHHICAVYFEWPSERTGETCQGRGEVEIVEATMRVSS